MIEETHQPQFALSPGSRLYGQRVPVPYYLLDGLAQRDYQEGGERRDVIVETMKAKTRKFMLSRTDVTSITVYDGDGGVLYVWTREELGV
jgi:hypothetical protein